MSLPRLFASLELFEQPFDQAMPELRVEWGRFEVVENEQPLRILGMVLSELLDYIKVQPASVNNKDAQRAVNTAFNEISFLREQAAKNVQN